ncbi:mitochondrial inner membrane protease ATP23 homolog isoform X2 [Grammomys surdaster]|uniref:mitochondrial inner membrane protease ATP23 homolog isoform X2 n=1 Tax=Grammomys surdaster TaxID=491861 RepID=UPI0010A038D3|nr:mitochondrial inner membrane protease ATP23 homolog isoform X2 [Grammomys surdaster]
MAGDPGGGEPGLAASEPLLQRPDSGQGSPEPPAHGKPQQGFFSSLFTRDQSCPLMLLKTLETNPYVRLLLDAMKHSGCAVNRERHFSCEVCDGNVSGGFDASTSQIVLCENNIRNQAHMGRVVTHELIHAFDHCRAHVQWFTNIRHLACSEIRAASLSGDCSLVNELSRLRFGLKRHHQRKETEHSHNLNKAKQNPNSVNNLTPSVWDSVTIFWPPPKGQSHVSSSVLFSTQLVF